MMEKFFETLKLAAKTLKANKLRSSLTMLGVIIGVTSVILLVSIGSGLKSYITGQLESLGSNLLMVIPGEMEMSGSSGSMQGAGASVPKFTMNQQRELQTESTNIESVMAYTENNATLAYAGKKHITQVAGVTYEYPEIRDQYPTQGSFFNISQQESAKKVVVLGATVADKLFGSENPVGKKITVSESKFTVLGILEKKGAMGGADMDNQAFIPVTTALTTFEMDYVQAFWVQAKSKEQIEPAKEEIKKILLKTLKDDEFSVIDTKGLLSMVSQILGTLTIALAGIAGISLLVGGIGIMNIMLVSVMERTKEIGLRKAIGATPKIIMTQFLIESIVLSVGGGLIGIIIGFGGSVLINQFFPAMVTIWSVLLAFLVSVIIGVVFGVMPAARAARLNPIQALRYE